MHGGLLYERPRSAHPTSERGYSPLLPTPAAQEPGGTPERHLERKNILDGANRVTPTHLSLVIQLLPTPSANDHTGGGSEESRDGGPGLRGLAKLLPTPTARDYKDGVPCENVETNALLGLEVWRLTGEPTNPPSDAGSSLPESKPHHQLTIDDA